MCALLRSRRQLMRAELWVSDKVLFVPEVPHPQPHQRFCLLSAGNVDSLALAPIRERRHAKQTRLTGNPRKDETDNGKLLLSMVRNGPSLTNSCSRRLRWRRRKVFNLISSLNSARRRP